MLAESLPQKRGGNRQALDNPIPKNPKDNPIPKNPKDNPIPKIDFWQQGLDELKTAFEARNAATKTITHLDS